MTPLTEQLIIQAVEGILEPEKETKTLEEMCGGSENMSTDRS